MTKLDYDLKLKVVTEYLQGTGSITLSHKYGISHFSVFNWVDKYRRFGNAGLKSRYSTRKYSGDFKMYVLNWKSENHATYTRTAAFFDISNPGTIANWQRQLQDLGLLGLYGRDLAVYKEKLTDLQRENELLRNENQQLKENL
ncbi:helix-turn-helix domain-containing protein [Companilactobacillus sp. HBUAS56257]|uniref:helix-turn-helix domain-containing protein n=1 Tax=Companilactobacillus sp. HBUAS56257 TaxID=3109360 RepID=UPI002FF310D8